MTKWKFSGIRLSNAGHRALRTSPGAKKWAKDVADKIAAEASRQSGEEYGAQESPGRNRARAVVAPETSAAAVDSAANLTLLKSMNAGRS